MVVEIDEEKTISRRVVSSCAEIGGGLVAIDVPLGFPDPDSRRQCEVMGRKMLGSRASTIFFTPPRSALEADWPEARQLGVSKQAWSLRDAVFDAAAHAGPDWYETHPELAFRRLHGAPLPPKSTPAGIDLRRSLLPPNIDLTPDPAIPADDLLDAAVCALVALRIAWGEAEAVGGDDGAGRIWF